MADSIVIRGEETAENLEFLVALLNYHRLELWWGWEFNMALSFGEVAIVKGMLTRGDRQSDIAAYFGENSGRISEINTGLKWGDVPEAGPSDLPAPGPYFISGRAAIRAKETPTALRELIDETLQEIEAWESASKEG